MSRWRSPRAWKGCILTNTPAVIAVGRIETQHQSMEKWVLPEILGERNSGESHYQLRGEWTIVPESATD
ncbi:hypothetical protein [Stieleria varia]|uniref:hypothetical protein n=1 Tax=Stieleria varia TaxID=2528005 RepID=UPI0011B3C2FA|nr:hypothetical protein [Stieleria varia]